MARIASPDGGRQAALRLAAYSFLILFFELALIRYVPANVKVFSFYINLVLIATFVGMGAGLLATRHAGWLRWMLLPLTLLLLALMRWFSNVLVEAPADRNEYLWAHFFETAPSVTQIGMIPTVGIIFAVSSLFFVPLGAMLGEEFRRFRPLTAYSVDIAGSLLGIIVFGFVSLSGWSPWLWFVLGFSVLLLASVNRPRFALAVLATAPLAVGLVLGAAKPNELWSPYYRINWHRPIDPVYAINVNASLHLTAIDFSEPSGEFKDWMSDVQRSYRAPYRLVERMDTVLVLGSGAGNDVALLLQLGAKHVDAVEIDPQIAELGRRLHFQNPYSDPRVRLHVDDARAFLRHPPHRYDLVVFGTLDSQTLLSGMASVRLDNYVYTVEALRDARDALAPQGRLVMYHMSPMPAIAAKIFQLLATVFEEPPQVFHWRPHILFNYAFVSGAWSGDEWREVQYPPELLMDVRVPSDDWPYLYLVRPTLPAHYLRGLAVILVFSTLLVLTAGGRELRTGTDLQMFLLGVGFLLLETKSVTEMSLLFGSTWGVNLLVFSSVLMVILVANLLVLRRESLHLRPVIIALLASLAVGYLFPVRALAGGSVWAEWIVGGALVAAPIFFAAIAFAVLFSVRANSVRSLGYNLLGAAVGGVLEYSVMILGVKNLYLLAALAYVAVWALNERKAAALRPAKC